MEVGVTCFFIECPPAVDPTNETSGTIMLLFGHHVISGKTIIYERIHLQPRTFNGKYQTCRATIDERRKHFSRHRMVFLSRCCRLSCEQLANVQQLMMFSDLWITGNTNKHYGDYACLRFKPGSSHVGFVVDKVALGQVLSEYFGFPCKSSFHQFLHNHHHLSSGAGTIDQ
jgi:hypothetical protein